MQDQSITSPDTAATPSSPQTGHDAALHPPGGFHVLKRVGGGYLAVTTRRANRWDTAPQPAWWLNADAARKWASRRLSVPYIIEPCDLDRASCVLRPKRNAARPARVTVAELQEVTGLAVGRAAMLRIIAAKFSGQE